MYEMYILFIWLLASSICCTLVGKGSSIDDKAHSGSCIL